EPRTQVACDLGCRLIGGAWLRRPRVRALPVTTGAQHIEQQFADLGINLLARLLAQRPACLLMGTPRPIAAVRGHRLVGVTAGDDACAERDVVAGQAIGVSRAIPTLVTGADKHGYRSQRRGGAEDALPKDRVLM